MSLYDLATAPSQSVQTLVVIKPSGSAADDDPGETSTTTVVVPPPPTEIKTALTKLARFIPTESITIYLGAVSTVAAIAEAGKNGVGASDSWITKVFTPEILFWITALVITPLIFLLIRAITQIKQNKKIRSKNFETDDINVLHSSSTNNAEQYCDNCNHK